MPISSGAVDGRELQREVVEFTVSFEPYVSALLDDLVAGNQDDQQGPGDPGWRAGSRDSSSVGVAIALSVIRVPHDVPPTLPASSLRTLRGSVREGVTLESILRGYRTSHAIFQDHIFRHAERTGASMDVVRRVTESLFAYYDWVLPLIAAEYAREQASIPERGDPGQLERIERALAGAPTDDLGYDLDQIHVAVVVERDDGAAAVQQIAAALGLPVLSGTTPAGQAWAWLGGASVAAVAEQLALLPGGGHAGVSEPEAGPHGFAGAHRKALIALRIGLMRDIDVSVYRDIALEALAFGGEDVAVDFARAELGRLAEGTRRVAILRETVQEYFAQGSSTAATARSLGIAERTVTYRLRRAEELIGRPVAERRADLETALRLHDVLDIS